MRNANCSDKLRVAEKEYAETELVLESARLEKESVNISQLTNAYKKVKRTNLMLMEKLTSLVKELKEKPKRSIQKEEIEEMLMMLEVIEEITRLSIHKEFLQPCQEAKSQAQVVASAGGVLGFKTMLCSALPPSPLPFSSTALRTCPPDCHPHQWFPSPGGPGSQGNWFQEPWLGLRWGGGSSGYRAQVLSSEPQLSWLRGDRTASSQWLRLLHSAPLRFSWVGPRGSYSLAGRGPQEPYSSLFSFPH